MTRIAIPIEASGHRHLPIIDRDQATTIYTSKYHQNSTHIMTFSLRPLNFEPLTNASSSSKVGD